MKVYIIANVEDSFSFDEGAFCLGIFESDKDPRFLEELKKHFPVKEYLGISDGTISFTLEDNHLIEFEIQSQNIEL